MVVYVEVVMKVLAKVAKAIYVTLAFGGAAATIVLYVALMVMMFDRAF